MKTTLLGLILAALMASLPLLSVGTAQALDCGGPGTQQTAAAYRSSSGERLDACFDRAAERVTLRMPDGRTVTLPLAPSASGARYGSGQEVFWEHQGTGRYFSGETLLFEGTVVDTADGYRNGVVVKELVRTGVTADGRKIAYPVTEKPEVTALLVELPPGSETGWHKHPVPVHAYLLGGSLKVELAGGRTVQYKAGEVIIEVVNTLHNGRTVGIEPARLIVFYLGVQGTPAVVRVP
ncbi:cupin domain-containing protein [Trichlorobacter ammonificans]|uniref:Membrane-bound lysozyme-inhibitor of c-type lysozyme n=1 Tax=Trichlorobacter ammonificans TaxID=2916410 RepID=A0ABN8HIG1_9BACT|nr:cupin domain-containing protein [Trichlorobacter ammonificans]CAH2030938.1 Membrane-bound lysozyme-inhibitor of c-type lysozyme [Trichlorobacter ammonificans]